MVLVIRQSWPLLLGLLLLLVGNGIQGTLLGIRGALEGLDPTTMSWIMSAYFAGFLLGSRRAPILIRNVGHVRVFAALASMISAVFILYAAAPTAWSWILMRFVVGFCFSGVYVVTESWLNESSTNETRGMALSLYMVVQMLGMISAQGILNFGDPSGYSLFILMSVLVSVSFLPILLSVTPAPAFQTTKPMTLRELYRASPLGCIGIFLLGGVFSGLIGMSAVFGTEQGLTVGQISLFVAAIYAGGLALQIPIGAASDRIDRRVLITMLAVIGVVVGSIAFPFSDRFAVIVALGALFGAVANPLYSLLIAYTNDYLDPSDMAAASGGMLFLNGVGATIGPIFIGWMMRTWGAEAFFVYLIALLAILGGFAAYRMTKRASADDTIPYRAISPTASPVAFEANQEVAIEIAEAHEEENQGGMS
ncbi:MFS transporter [Amaricoccus macauensis]|uniref:MFS transporter n=1 Tax=Amaricoccus macauensis TaxID=57001 RepID=UPI003C7BC445